MQYVRFVASHARFLAFGFLLPFFSAFGQTFFIGIFGGELRAEFGLTNGEFGLTYSLATVGNAVLFVWLGRLIDRVDLRLYTAATCVAYVGACLFMAWMPAWPALLFVGFLLLRLTGQGLMSHIGVTTMGRYFDAERGKAVSLASLGFPAAEAVFPAAGVALMGAAGWRGAWLAIGGSLAVVLIPLILWLLRGHARREAQRRDAAADRAATEGNERDWLMGEVLRDPSFHRVLPAVLLPSFTATGLFFHQAHLVASKGWSMEWFAMAFTVYAASSIAGTLACGALIDRFGATRLLPVFLAPAAAGLALLAGASAPWVAVGFMIGAGLTAGSALTLLGALWAEMYGVLHLGSIRSLVWGLVVLASALSPVLFGVLLDLGVGFEAISAGCLLAAVGASALAAPVRHVHAYTRSS